MMGHGGGGGGMGMGGGGGPGPGGRFDGWDDDRIGRVYDHKVMMRILPYLTPYKGWVAVALAGMLVTTGASIAIPWLIGYGVDVAFQSQDPRRVAFVAIVFLGAAAANALGNFVQMRFMAKIAQAMLVRIRRQLFDHLQTLSLSFFDRSQVGRLMSRVVSDVEQIQQVLTGGLIGVLADLLTLLGIVVVMFLLSPILAAVTLSTVPVLILIAVLWQGRARTTFMEVRRAISIVNGSLQENVSGVRAVQSLQREDENLRRFERLNRDHLDANLRASRLSAAMMPVVEILVGVATGLIIVVGGWMVIQGSMNVGVVVSFGLFIQRFFEPIRNVTMQYTELQRAMASGVRIFELLDTKPEVDDPLDAREMPPVKGGVTFDHVSFSYQPDVPVLQDVNFKAEPGETIAIVGSTGAGKTTFVSLISRFYDVTAGSVKVDGIDVRGVRRESLARQMGMVLQEPFLFSGTVEENIRFGRPEATYDEVVTAAKAANIHDVIVQMENGYQTVLRERGVNLSVGHRQLVSIARAILADPRILILDEATANIDTQTELLVQQALSRLLAGRTSFVIAHRLSTVREASRILVLDKGRIVEEGTHAALLAKGGAYARLYAMTYARTAVPVARGPAPVPAGGSGDNPERG